MDQGHFKTTVEMNECANVTNGINVQMEPMGRCDCSLSVGYNFE